MLEESEPVRFTSGEMASRSGSNSVANFGVRATDQLRLPSTVLISPLCAR